MSPLKPGTFHVRACFDGLQSKWVEITAKYRTFDVTFKPQNGEEAETAAVRKGQTAGQLPVEFGKCRTFIGWFTDKDCTELYDFDTPVTEDITLYGGWADSHLWKTGYTIDKAATLAAAGSKSIHCSVCNTVKPGSKVTIPKLKVNPTALSALTAAGKAFTAKWKKASGVTGYELQYALNKKFTSGKKNVKIKKAAAVSKKVTKLKAKKKYFVRIRAYKTFKGKNYYSTWSKVKSVTTKK